MKLSTKQIYDLEPLVQELQSKGHAFIEASKAEFMDIMSQLADAGHTVTHDAEAPTKQGHHFVVYTLPVVAAYKAKAKAVSTTGAKRGPKPGQVGNPKTYTGIKDGDVFTGTLTDLAKHFSINRMTAYKSLQKSGGKPTKAAGVDMYEFGHEEAASAPKADEQL